MKKYTPSHEWIEIQEDIGTVGITSFAQKELGDVVYIQLPSCGKTIQMGEEVVVLESTKAAADIYSPASGEVIAINETLLKNPKILNESPEELGWLFKLKVENKEEVLELLSETEYRLMIE